MKRKLLAFAGFCVAIVSHAQDISKELDSIVNTYVQLGKFNGSVLVAQKGTILLNKGYGLSDAASKKPNTENSIFQLGSITKQFTATIILKLQEQKKLSVSDKLSKYFSDFPKGDSITIEQLMTHTAGIYNYTDDRDFMNTQVTKPHTREQMLALFKDKPLDFSPGTNWSYSNSGYMLLGYIIEDVTKKPFEAVVRDYIFNPLQMNSSGFDFAALQHPLKTTGYFMMNEQDTLQAVAVDSSVSYAAGSIYSTIGDLYKWHKALQNNTILSKAQQDKAYTPVKNKYGYGWMIDTIVGKRRIHHGGGIHGYVTNFARIPEDDLVVVALSNTSSPAVYDITNMVLHAIYKKPYELPKRRNAITLPESKMQEYVGEYEITPQLHLVITIQDGKLQGKPTGQRQIELLVEKEDYLYVNTPEIRMHFKRNEKNEITGFTLFQSGMEIECKKIK